MQQRISIRNGVVNLGPVAPSKFKLEFKADRVQIKMVQRTIVVHQFTAAYLIEFTLAM